MNREQCNALRYRPGDTAGHYESYYLRANHPSLPLAFWIRYTIFSPVGHPEEALGEIWVVVFDGSTNEHVALKAEFPFADCTFDPNQLSIQIGRSTLDDGSLRGSIALAGRTIEWDLTYSGKEDPVFLLKPELYRYSFPRAKSLVAVPLARFDGSIVVNGSAIAVDGWTGSQNHNWGSRHTDTYAFGQVAGFDTHPDSFLEAATVQLKVGPFFMPPMTTVVLKHREFNYELIAPATSSRATGSLGLFHWTFRSEDEDAIVEATIDAPREAFVGLRYRNPPGGEKHCLNTKIGRCSLKVVDKLSGDTEELLAENRALFEIVRRGLSLDHGIKVLF